MPFARGVPPVAEWTGLHYIGVLVLVVFVFMCKPEKFWDDLEALRHEEEKKAMVCANKYAENCDLSKNPSNKLTCSRLATCIKDPYEDIGEIIQVFRSRFGGELLQTPSENLENKLGAIDKI